MMGRARWWAMYLTSATIGYFLAYLMVGMGQRFTRPIADIVRETARGHAENAQHRVGPYLAPVTFVAILALGTVIGATLIRWLS